jgi:hypothetical protein
MSDSSSAGQNALRFQARTIWQNGPGVAEVLALLGIPG